jgi:cysteine-S-conjugate beta-lyase
MVPPEKRLSAKLSDATRLVHLGRDPEAQHGFVNPPVYHASTLLYPTAEDQVAHRARYSYGRRGTPTSEALENALRELDGAGCAGVALLPSGLAAIAAALLATTQSGDHILVVDSVYRPTRTFCNGVLKRMGVETTYYDPLAGADIGKLFKPNTRAVFVEAPGSQSFEMQDIPAIADVAHGKKAVVLMDNTWATPLYFRAFEKGVDLEIQAGTKYIGGHSDIMFGCVSANASTLPALKDTVYSMGLCVGPDDMYLAMRGLRTLGVRLARHHQSGLQVAKWLEKRPEVLRVLHPALETGPGHDIWKRDFSGACGLFSIVLKPASEKSVHAFLNELSLFGLGYSWGGFESLAILFDCSEYRTATKWAPGGPTIRFHIGLEDPADLIADLERGLAALASA